MTLEVDQGVSVPTSNPPAPDHARRALSRRRHAVIFIASTYPLALTALVVAQLVAQARGGPLGLAMVVAPYLFLPLVALLPLLLLRGTVVLRLAFVACLLCGLRFAPRFPTAPSRGDTSGMMLTVMTWNVAFGHADAEAVRRFVESRPAEIVALEEDYASWWDPDYTRWTEREAALARVYPYQIRRHSQGLTLLSIYPILESSEETAARDTPPVAWGRFDLGNGRTLVVAAAHPHDPLRGDCDPRRLCYDPAVRDAEIRQIRAATAPFLAHGEPLVLAGDFNVTERELAYRELADGLWDAQRAVGSGLGHTWRPFALARQLLPLLRIDYVLGSPTARPLSLRRDCTTPGADHCALFATLALP
jgi:endonuclease/exonuclease/phosphatase (EEP) superfamily protein YafD